jgi:hypothetical protein
MKYSAMTTESQLYKMAKSVGLKVLIVTIDELKELRANSKGKSKIYENYIINIGGHWVALTIYKKKAYYFNSFADIYGSIHSEILSFLRNCNYIIYNKISIQDPKHGFCGELSLDFLIHMNPNKNIENYISFLDMFKNLNKINELYHMKNPTVTL